MGVIKVETFDVDVTNNNSTHTLTNSVGTTSKGFVRRVGSIDKQSGPTGSTGNTNANVACIAAQLSDVSTITFRKNTSTTVKCVGEVWRYTGAASGADEFIVRGRSSITITGTSGLANVSGIVDRDKCIPFFLGAQYDGASVNDYDAATVSMYINSSNQVVIERGSNTGTLTAYFVVVEFTGVNWTVGHGRSASHDTATETVTLNTASDGISGSAFNVGSWNNAMIIEGSLEGDTSETGLSDNLGVWKPAAGATQADFILQQDGAARNDGVAYCHVLCHPSMTVIRGENTNYPEGNGTYANQSVSGLTALDESSLEWFADTTGTGTAHARGRLSAYLTSTTNLTNWVHRSGNNVRINYGAVNLSGLTGAIPLAITNVDGDDIVGNAQQNVLVNSNGGFEALQGEGTVVLADSPDGTGNVVALTVNSWSDNQINVDISAGVQADSFAYLVVTTDGGAQGSRLIQVGVPPETYQEAMEALTPAWQHYWPFQNSYVDVIGSANANGVAANGTTFDTTPIVKGDTHSLLLDSITDYCSPSDQSDMNTSSTAQRRYMGGWIMLDRVLQGLTVIWEEGAQVNNYALLIGYGNRAVWQFADDGGDYVQAYHDIALTPNRPYHVLMEFQGPNFNGGICGCWLDGVKQSLTNGNPWEVTAFPSHSGNISWGHEGTENLQTGDSRGVDNVDIAFASPNACRYAHWYSVQQQSYTESQIRQEMFAKGALADTIIGGDTQANMQIAVDAVASTVIPDYPCGIEIGSATEGSFTLTFDNITFSDRCSMPVRYMGGDTLTIVLANGSDLDESKCEAPYGGTIIFERPATLTVEGIINGGEIRLYDDNGQAANLPTVVNSRRKISATGSTQETFNFLSTPTLGNLLITACVNDKANMIGLPNVFAGGWTEICKENTDDHDLVVYAKISDGTETNVLWDYIVVNNEFNTALYYLELDNIAGIAPDVVTAIANQNFQQADITVGPITPPTKPVVALLFTSSDDRNATLGETDTSTNNGFVKLYDDEVLSGVPSFEVWMRSIDNSQSVDVTYNIANPRELIAALTAYEVDTAATNGYGFELAGEEANVGTTLLYSHAGVSNDIVVQLIADGFEELVVPFTLGGTDQTLTLLPKADLNE